MKKIIITLLGVWMFSSCEDVLNIDPKDRISDAAVWTDAGLVTAYHNSLYNCLTHGFNINMQSKSTDEAVCVTGAGGAEIIPMGTVTPDNVTSVSTTSWTGGGNLYYWDAGYQYIRRINIFLEKMAETSLEMENKAQLVAEAKFLRAFIYTKLLERFGGVPLVTQSYELSTTETFTSAPYDECVAFIAKDLSEAMPDLPVYNKEGDATFGRATQAAGQALLSHLYLYAASPLFNESGDQSKWQRASDAAKAFMDTYTMYSLHPDYTTLFNQASGSANNEIIFARNFTLSSGHDLAMNNLNRYFGAYGGWWASNGPSQNLVDDYDMANGEPPFIWGANGAQTINPASGYDPQKPYDNRDPRFYATIIYNGSTYHGHTFEMWVSSDKDNPSWGIDNFLQAGDNPLCNYVLRKFMPGDDVVLSWQVKSVQPWIFFRLGEIYLNYAEAQFELGNEAVCREYINKIRDRAGMPDLPATITGENLRARLYNERRIEMAFEEQRYFDVRRWKIAMDIENRPMRGMDVIKDASTGVISYDGSLVLLEKHFNEKMYLLPIATAEIRKNNGTLQQSVTWR
jgi:hypothetical protein